LETLAEKDKRNSTLQYFLAEQYVAAKQLDKAEALYKATLEASGGSEGNIGLVGIYRTRKQAAPLLDVLVKAVKGGRGLERLEPELKAISQDDKLLEGLIATGRKQLAGDEPQLDVAAAIILAKLAAEAKKTAAAVDFYQFALKGARQEQATALYNELGDHLMEVRNYAEAAKVFRKAASDPALSAGRPNYLFRLSQAHELSGNTKSALEAVAEARKILPDVPLLHYQEGWVHYHAENWDQAVRVFEAVMAKYPQQTDIVRRCQFSLSNIYVQQGNIRKGEEILEKVLAEDPDNISVNNDLGYLYADQNKNLEKAEKMIRKAITAEPENAAYLDSMGWVLYRLGKYAEAATYLEKAVKLPTGSDGTIWDHLGDCYLKLDKKDKTVDAWQKALKDSKTAATPDKELIQKIEKKLKDAGAKPASKAEKKS
jgi:Tfp pilus assembly protein PilF